MQLLIRDRIELNLKHVNKRDLRTIVLQQIPQKRHDLVVIAHAKFNASLYVLFQIRKCSYYSVENL